MSSFLRSAFISAPTSPVHNETLTNTVFAGAPSGTLPSWTYTAGAVVVALLALEQTRYRYLKRHLPGDAWTIPIIGRFLNSMNPTLENYKAGWAKGALSVVSVFHMWVPTPTVGVTAAR
jgi:C-22 sterol desaturase